MREKRIYIDLNHPADFHLFKGLIRKLQEEGWKVGITARDKDCLHSLLQEARIPFRSRGRGSSGRRGKYLSAPRVLWLLFFRMLWFRPALSLSLSSPYLILASRLVGVPSVCYDDTDINPRIHPFIAMAGCVLSPENYRVHFHRRHFRLPLMKELAYLDPGDPGEREGLFVRLARGDSIHHGEGSAGLPELAMEMIRELSEKHPVWLSQEIPPGQEIPAGLRGGVMAGAGIAGTGQTGTGIRSCGIYSVHSELERCRVFWGNSATMAAEAAVLGIPAVFVSDEKFCYIEELEERGLLFHFPLSRYADSFRKLEALLEEPSPGPYPDRARRLREEKLDTGDFLFRFVRNFPSGMALAATPDDEKQST